MEKFTVNIYSGRTYCGNGFFKTFEECVDYFNRDPFATRATILNSETNEKTTIKRKDGEQ